MGTPWELRRRGLKDSLRHDQRVKEAIKKNLRELITEEAIITSDGTKRIRIPLRYLDQYRFKYGQPPQDVGQGPGQPGEIIGRRNDQGNDPGDGQPGDQQGEHTYEVNIQLEDLTRMMLEDLALPWLEEKAAREIIETTFEMTDRRHLPRPISRIDVKRTALRNIKRNKIQGNDEKVGHFSNDDIITSTWRDKEEKHANAAVYMLMDRSGSMTMNKKYVAKSFFFWMVRFLRLKYQHVETVFIAHDVEAQVVPEQDFFALTNSGGTVCSSAYKTAIGHIELNHPSSRWNIYLFHFSDGDNMPYDNAVCKELVQELLMHCNMVGYGEIRYKDDASFYGWMSQTSAAALSSLQSALQEVKHPRLVSVTISHKDELLQMLKTFLTPRDATSPPVSQMKGADPSLS